MTIFLSIGRNWDEKYELYNCFYKYNVIFNKYFTEDCFERKKTNDFFLSISVLSRKNVDQSQNLNYLNDVCTECDKRRDFL